MAKNKYGNWKQSKMKNAVVTDKPTHEHVNNKVNIDSYGGYLVAESVFNDEIRELIIKSPKLMKAGKEMFKIIHRNGYDLRIPEEMDITLGEYNRKLEYWEKLFEEEYND